MPHRGLRLGVHGYQYVAVFVVWFTLQPMLPCGAVDDAAAAAAAAAADDAGRAEASASPAAAAGLSALAAAMRRRRAARAPAEVQQAAIAALRAAAAPATAAGSRHTRIIPLDSAAQTAAVVCLNEERLPGKVCTQALTARLQSNRASCLIALDDSAGEDSGGSAVVGFVLCEASGGSVDVVLLAVAATATGRGIGRALLTAALAGAAVAGCVTTQSPPSQLDFQEISDTFLWCSDQCLADRALGQYPGGAALCLRGLRASGCAQY